jgi:hypothetical protein
VTAQPAAAEATPAPASQTAPARYPGVGPGAPSPQIGSESHERTERSQRFAVDSDAPGIIAILVEYGLAEYRRNGRTRPPEYVQNVLAQLALSAPAVVVALCPHLLAALSPDVAKTVSDLASAPAVRDPATATPDLRHWLTVAEAAGQLGISHHGVRDRCRRGTLTAMKHKIDGRWRIDAKDLG